MARLNRRRKKGKKKEKGKNWGWEQKTKWKSTRWEWKKKENKKRGVNNQREFFKTRGGERRKNRRRGRMKKKGGEWGKTSKTRGGRGEWKIREQGRKNPNGGEEEVNKKNGFHQMTIKFAHFARILLALLDDDQSVATKFDCHCWMVNKMD